MSVRYAHTNLVAKSWRALSAFYCQVFACTPVPPERAIDAPWLARGTGVANAKLRGIHLRLPGHGDRGPTLEIFEYVDQPARERHAVANEPGFGHIAFEVDDVAATRDRVLAAGGRDVGEIVTASIEAAGTITFTYVADPEGNIIELQQWS